MEYEESRRKLVDGMLGFTDGTPVAADEFERDLLEKYVRGKLTIEEVLLLLLEKEASL